MIYARLAELLTTALSIMIELATHASIHTQHSHDPFAVLYLAGCLPPWGCGRLLKMFTSGERIIRYPLVLHTTAVRPDFTSRQLHSRPLVGPAENPPVCRQAGRKKLFTQLIEIACVQLNLINIYSIES